MDSKRAIFSGLVDLAHGGISYSTKKIRNISVMVMVENDEISNENVQFEKGEKYLGS